MSKESKKGNGENKSRDTEDEQTNRFGVIIGGVHPEGNLTPEVRDKIQKELRQLESEDELQVLAEILENIYYEHGERITEILRRYSQLSASLVLDKHISYISYQNDVLDGSVRGNINHSCEEALYDSFMQHLNRVILYWASMYSDKRKTTDE